MVTEGGGGRGSCRNAHVSYICFIFSPNEPNQNIYFIVSPNEPNKNICFIFPPTPKKTRENQKKKANISTLWPYGYPLAPHSLWSLFFLFFLVFSSFFLFLTKSGSCLGHLLVCWRFFSQNSFKILTFTTPPPIATSSLFFGWVGLSYTFRLQFAKGASQQLRRKQPQPWNDSDALRDAALGNYGGNVTRLSEWPSAPSSGQVQVRKIMRRISTG